MAAMLQIALALLPTLLLQSTTAVAHSWDMTCPKPEDISPCSCIIVPQYFGMLVTCDGVTLTDVEAAFRHLRGKDVKVMELRNLKVDRLPSKFFSGLRVSDLHILECDLKGVADTDDSPAFEGIQHLVKLYIYKSIKGANELTALNLAHLKDLKVLILAQNNIPELRNDWFGKGPGSLEEVYIELCGIRILGDRVFQPLANLRFLDLKDNPFRTFRRSMLPQPATRLAYLRLQNASLESFPEDMFSEMPSLTHVILGFNPIRRLPEVTWSSIWTQLEDVNFFYNPLDCDSHIEWTFKLEPPNRVSGTCESPAERKDMQLSDLIDLNRKSALQRKKMHFVNESTV